ncbi:MAG: hypothetical protein GY847_12420 [Proteobacteria bacterium]|nr:hypothetical protein [Pseudomonadota bacterium]
MQTRVDKILEEIATDFKNGATSLAGRGLDALEVLAQTLPEDPKEAKKQVVSLIERLKVIRPSIGAIGVQAVLAASRAQSLVKEGTPWKVAMDRAVLKERENLNSADQIIADLLLQEIGSGGVIVSCSKSATVKSALVALKPDLVRMGEGHRMGDGVNGAKSLANNGIKVEIVPDGALPVAVEDAKAVIIGADQVLANGSVVNRCSSFSLALAAHRFGVPFIVVCQRIKLTGRAEVTIEESSKLFQDLPKGVTSRAPIFDITPADLVHRVITETSAMTPTKAGEKGKIIAELDKQIL